MPGEVLLKLTVNGEQPIVRSGVKIEIGFGLTKTVEVKVRMPQVVNAFKVMVKVVSLPSLRG